MATASSPSTSSVAAPLFAAAPLMKRTVSPAKEAVSVRVSEIVRAFVVPPVVVPRVFSPRTCRRNPLADRGRLLNQRSDALVG
jgi:hypothetical protein